MKVKYYTFILPNYWCQRNFNLLETIPSVQFKRKKKKLLWMLNSSFHCKIYLPKDQPWFKWMVTEHDFLCSIFMKLKTTLKKDLCEYTQQEYWTVIYLLRYIKDLLGKASILLCKILRNIFKKHMFQHNCPVDAHFKSESKNFHSVHTKLQFWASPKYHLHDWAKSTTT